MDVRAGGKPVFTDLTNPKEDSAEVAAGTVKADVVLAGEKDVVIGPASLKLAEGTTISSSLCKRSAACTAFRMAFRVARGDRPQLSLEALWRPLHCSVWPFSASQSPDGAWPDVA